MISHSNESVLMDDANSPELNKKILGIVSSDFIKVSDQLKDAAYQIKVRGFSNFPIFVVSRTKIEIGVELIEKFVYDNNYLYNATFLDEFVQRNLIGEESVELFKENYKNTDEYCCLFVIEAEFAGFIFIPYPEDEAVVE